MDLKAKIARSSKIAKKQGEIKTYEMAIKAIGRFTPFYQSKIVELKADLGAIE